MQQPRIERCIGCGTTWNIARQQRIEGAWYVCPHCACRIRSGESVPEIHARYVGLYRRLRACKAGDLHIRALAQAYGVRCADVNRVYEEIQRERHEKIRAHASRSQAACETESSR